MSASAIALCLLLCDVLDRLLSWSIFWAHHVFGFWRVQNVAKLRYWSWRWKLLLFDHSFTWRYHLHLLWFGIAYIGVGVKFRVCFPLIGVTVCLTTHLIEVSTRPIKLFPNKREKLFDVFWIVYCLWIPLVYVIFIAYGLRVVCVIHYLLRLRIVLLEEILVFLVIVQHRILFSVPLVSGVFFMFCLLPGVMGWMDWTVHSLDWDVSALSQIFGLNAIFICLKCRLSIRLNIHRNTRELFQLFILLPPQLFFLVSIFRTFVAFVDEDWVSAPECILRIPSFLIWAVWRAHFDKHSFDRDPTEKQWHRGRLLIITVVLFRLTCRISFLTVKRACGFFHDLLVRRQGPLIGWWNGRLGFMVGIVNSHLLLQFKFL